MPGENNVFGPFNVNVADTTDREMTDALMLVLLILRRFNSLAKELELSVEEQLSAMMSVSANMITTVIVERMRMEHGSLGAAPREKFHDVANETVNALLAGTIESLIKNHEAEADAT